MSATIEPEPSEAEREAIVAAIGGAADVSPDEWTKAALVEGVESGELDP